jgi:hypothetical protein
LCQDCRTGGINLSIEVGLGNKTGNFVEGLIYEHLLRGRDVSIKTEDADRLVRDFRNSQPVAGILLEATGETDKKVYKAQRAENSKLRTFCPARTKSNYIYRQAKNRLNLLYTPSALRRVRGNGIFR